MFLIFPTGQASEIIYLRVTKSVAATIIERAVSATNLCTKIFKCDQGLTVGNNVT